MVHFKDLIDGLTMQEQVDEVTGLSQLVVMDSPDEKRQPHDRSSGPKAARGPTRRSTSCRPTLT